TKAEALILDAWNFPGYYENAFYTEPFQKVLLAANHTPVETVAPVTATHIFRVKAPLLTKGRTLCLLGGNGTLKNWDTAAPVLMSRAAGEDCFTVQLDLSGESFPIEYKYGVYDGTSHQFVRFEDGNNRVLRDNIAPGKQTILNDGFAVLPNDTWKGAGVSVPV